MTFINTRLRLAKPPAPHDFTNLSRLSTMYGIRGVSVDGQDLTVEYDGSRIHEAEILAAVRNVGVAAEPVRPFPPGSFDYTGEFKDYAWPMVGLSPANQKQKQSVPLARR